MHQLYYDQLNLMLNLQGCWLILTNNIASAVQLVAKFRVTHFQPMHCLVVTATMLAIHLTFPLPTLQRFLLFRADADVIAWMYSTDALFVPGSSTPSPWAICLQCPSITNSANCSFCLNYAIVNDSQCVACDRLTLAH